MSETAILGIVVTALWGITLALVAVVWSMLQGRISTLEKDVEGLQTQNTMQEVAIGRLTENAKSQADAREQHREDTSAQFARIDSSLSAMNGKLDRLVAAVGRSYTPGSEPYRAPIKREDR